MLATCLIVGITLMRRIELISYKGASRDQYLGREREKKNLRISVVFLSFGNYI